MDYKQVDKKYRAIPFWSWNEKLDPEETRRQVALMDEAGIGGFFMHARGGLLTEYMGEEWFENVRAAVDEATRRGMHPWAYDENGWPSGFGGGKVNALGIEYWEKHLAWEPATPEKETAKDTLLVRDGKRYYYICNPFYVDTASGLVIRRFIDEIYEEYYKRMGNTFDGFFTDEPQMSRAGMPWSFTLPEQFRAAYGYDITEHIDSLFFDVGDFSRVRTDYWKMMTALFAENYSGQIYRWCEEHGYRFTGHMVCEDTLTSQLWSNGAAMPQYQHYHIPGMDWLCRNITECLTPLQVGSVAAQTGKKQVLSETFALCGHNVSHNELKGIYEWQMVHGINLLCTHLEGYSLRGIRKRDYPPAMYYQQPWWEDMHLFFDLAARTGMLLSEGEQRPTTLLIHPQTSAWILACEDEFARRTDRTGGIYRALLADMRTLEDKHVLFHLGDESMMESMAQVRDGRIHLGEMSYEYLVIPENAGLLPSTERLIAAFRAAGGKIVTAAQHPVNPVCEPNRLTYTYRHLDGADMHYFVNTWSDEITACIAVGSEILDPVTGETRPFSGTHTFRRYESLILLDTGASRAALPPQKVYTSLDLSGTWTVKDATYNSLTLDRCDYWVDGEMWGENAYVLDILPRINELRRPVQLRQKYTFEVEVTPQTLFLCTETPSLFRIAVNGHPVDTAADAGFFRDSSFRLLDIAAFVRVGTNTVTLESTVSQRPETYEHLSNSWTFEAMRNCLSYDTEIEQIYLVGDFGVRLPAEREELPRDAYRITGSPVLVASPAAVDICRLEDSGYPTFAGALTLERTFTLAPGETDRTVTLRGTGINSVHLSVNGEEVAVRMWEPYEVNLSDCLRAGENTLTLRIVNNLRNMQGPFHLRCGESYSVGPSSFYRESNVFCAARGAGESCHDVLDHWDDGICLVHFGLR